MKLSTRQAGIVNRAIDWHLTRELHHLSNPNGMDATSYKRAGLNTDMHGWLRADHALPASPTKSLLEEIGLSIPAVNARSADYGVAIAEYLSKQINYNQLAARMGPTTMGR